MMATAGARRTRTLLHEHCQPVEIAIRCRIAEDDTDGLPVAAASRAAAYIFLTPSSVTPFWLGTT